MRRDEYPINIDGIPHLPYFVTAFRRTPGRYPLTSTMLISIYLAPWDTQAGCLSLDGMKVVQETLKRLFPGWHLHTKKLLRSLDPTLLVSESELDDRPLWEVKQDKQSNLSD